ncbi:MAG TPA: DNA polymerase III subunit gamma/tau [bacterium]|jgi:DNA polymerase-3 subunit gamma/tau|nr:DNA polymerase III subunit gamma/tau [bacterium]
MSYLVIARKWRPQTFEDVVGQVHVTRTLQNAISAGRVAHAYLFTGPRGVGKTSTARILAKALNCEKGPTPHPCLACPACLEVAGPGSVDVIEIDGASNNGVENIRDLREKVQYTGARDRYKVYIIDEVHMLSSGAFNALLKTLEEPPAHVVFIFATTEVAKLPATILSRTQRFDFRRVGAMEVAAQLAKILTAEGMDASSEALQLVARAGEGSVRDSQTLLDQVISYALGAGEKRALRAEDVLAVLGGVQEGQAWGALKAALTGDTAAALSWLQEQYQRGADLRQVLDAFQALLRGLLLLKAAPQGATEAELLPETLSALSAAAPGLSLSRLFTALKACAEAEQHLRYSNQTRLVIELLLLKLAPVSPGAGLGEIVDELRELEQKFRTLPAPTSAAEAPSAVPAAGPVPAAPAPVTAAPAAPSPVPERGQAPSATPVPAVAPAAPPRRSEDAGESVPAVVSLEEAPASGAAAPALALEALRRDWEAVVADVQNVSMSLASAAKDAELMALEGDTLTLKAVNGFQRKVLDEPQERVRLEAVLSKRHGRPLKVRVVFAPPAARGAKGGRPGEEQIERLLKDRPEVRRVQELFGAEIVEIRED